MEARRRPIHKSRPKTSNGLLLAATSRPAISADAKRQLLLETGHRCAVCGESCPLERAHIVPWCKSRDSKPENLILLCANCHQRADLERWGRKVLLAYKQKPWITRRFLNPHHDESNSRVELRLEIDVKEFDYRAQHLLVYALAAFLQISPSDVKIVSVNAGSVKVMLELPEIYQAALVEAYSKRDRDLDLYLKPFNLIGLSPILSSANVREPARLAAAYRIVHTVMKLTDEMGHRPTAEEVASRTGIPLNDVHKMLKLAQETISIETPFDEKIDYFGDSDEDRTESSPTEAEAYRNLGRKIPRGIKTLSPREEMVLRMRFGIDEHVLEEVGQSFAITRERMRQIESKALRKLRHPSRERRRATKEVDKAG